jgi:hypothetical protein
LNLMWLAGSATSASYCRQSNIVRIDKSMRLVEQIGQRISQRVDGDANPCWPSLSR